jgi:acyl-homoserine-lactone acylase
MRSLIERVCLLAALSATAWGPAAAGERPVDGVEVRRTTDGIPHIRAGDWFGLGFGVGHVQAEDALCTLADAFVTYEGRRSWFFGPEARPARNSTLGRPSNIDLDFFFRGFATDEMVAQYRLQNPSALQALVDGYAAGYNRHLAMARGAPGEHPSHACLDADWVRPIQADDVYRRLFAAQIVAGYARFIPEIVNAAPGMSPDTRADAAPVSWAHRVGHEAGLGSNMLAFGREATGESEGLLFGNPHWYWGGPDRFYQMHLTLPGQLDVAGVAFLGVPLVMIGFNRDVAWSHTVSEARRFGLFDLALDPADPTRVRIDGASEAMSAREVGVDLREGGQVRRVTRTLYRTRFGPVLNLGARDAALGWGTARALAIRDVNADNFRVFRNYLAWNQAASLDAFIGIQRREAAVPWVNTAAIGRGDPRAWYADLGAVPNVPDTLRDTCRSPLSPLFAKLDPAMPVLDGSRSACDWVVDAEAAQPGALPARAMPSLLTEAYVANMNDSHWLTHPDQPLEGFASVMGGERQPPSLRSQEGHRIAAALVSRRAGSAAALGVPLRQAVLEARAHSADVFKQELLDRACTRERVVLAGQGDAAAAQPVRVVPITEACRLLRQWDNTGDASDRGAVLWDAVWARLEPLPAASRYRVPFSSDRPLDSLRTASLSADDAARALAGAVAWVSDQGWRLDEPLGVRRFARSGGRRVPWYGGCHGAGYFTVACNHDGGYAMGPDSAANSYLQVVTFGPQGPQAHTMLAHGLRPSAVEGGEGGAAVSRYARKAWLRFPFTDAEIARDPRLTTTVLRP